MLLRKHEQIRRDLGISVPVPPQSDAVLAALLEGVLLRGKDSDQLTLDLGLQSAALELDEQWRSTAEQEKVSRARFAQARIRPDEVQAAVDAARLSLGDPADLPSFTRTVLTDLGAVVAPSGRGFTADLEQVPIGLLDALDRPSKPVTFVRTTRPLEGRSCWSAPTPASPRLAGTRSTPASTRPFRTRPVPLVDAASSPHRMLNGRRSLLLVRFRTHLNLPGRHGMVTHLAEEAARLRSLARPQSPRGLRKTRSNCSSRLTGCQHAARRRAQRHVRDPRVVAPLNPALEDEARRVADRLRVDHVSVRQAARGERAGALGIRGLEVTPQLPVDVLGLYLYRPVGGGS